MTSQKLIVALDFPSREQALAMARTLSGHVRWVKVGLELFCRTGPEIVSTLDNLGFKVFLDLKFMDIPHTVQGAVTSACAAGADMLTIHVTGGQAMVQAALRGARMAGKKPPLLIGVTVLTSMSSNDLALVAGRSRNLEDTVSSMAHQARTWGLDGIVCSGQEVQRIRQQCPEPFTIVTPGIRLKKDLDSEDDQKRVTTPKAALRAGSSYLVVGRPITRATDPVGTIQRYLDTIEEQS
ncbi:orotidine-5'-phosphate decarboxylase [Desulfoplanes formicivorans]|uniref:Orotidine 5'-phosphate decarboxylase n=1 Tax=Desulfoplanes formicivorans TaxID=1592317 RepID=A0A194AFF7_9BACT|nr:orotidine-5'-phosphate decarboxylase [Desulfoplanes formicivorans]GAU07514.1 orotidine-5'-phosphate decarboxylase [Desulfoplanes formicivorans]